MIKWKKSNICNTLYSRNRNAINVSYPEIVDALKTAVLHNAILDGEIVALTGDKLTFSRLQGRMQIRSEAVARQSKLKVHYYLFDILHYDGLDIRSLPLLERKNILKQSIKFNDLVRYTPHHPEAGLAYHRQACKKNWEGIIAKRAISKYVSKRSSDWLKFKCTNEDEFVIAGYIDPQGSRQGFGALLIGYYRGRKFHYAGKVGTGYSEQVLKDLKYKMDKLKLQEAPFADFKENEADMHFIKPKLVGQFAYLEMTDSGKLRHPRFLGLRRDKPAKEVRY